MHFSIWELALILLIVLVLFGGSRLRNLGSDLGSAIRGFRDAMKEGGAAQNPDTSSTEPKKLDQITQGHTTETVEPLVKERDKV